MTPLGNPESARCLCPFQGNLFSLQCLDFQAEDRLTPRWNVGQPCGKASWESLLGKPVGKATDPLIHAKESMILLLQLGKKRTCMPPLETKTDSPGKTQKYPKTHVSTEEEFSGSGNDATQGFKPA